MNGHVKPNHFLVDQHGRPEAVVLPLADYEKLLNLLEDAADVTTLRQAVRSSRGVIAHAQLLKRLKRKRLI